MEPDRSARVRWKLDPHYIQIACVGHSGSTLINTFLGAHPDIVSVGELMHLSDDWEKGRCVCGESLKECPFWSRVVQEFSGDLGLTPDTVFSKISLRGGLLQRRHPFFGLKIHDLYFLRLTKRKLSRLNNKPEVVRKTIKAAEYNYDILDKVVDITKKSIVIDSSKNPIRLSAMYLARPERFKCIYIVRDGRAVTKSWIKAYKHINSVPMAALQWHLRDRFILMALKNIPEEKCMRIRYEDLCRSPEKVLQQICIFIGIDYSEDIIKPFLKERHDLHVNKNFYFLKKLQIRLDDNWHRNWTKGQERRFNFFAGAWNKKHGYKGFDFSK